MITKEHTLKTTAIYSDDQKYRYSLAKMWNGEKPKATFIGINPSDATELIMDKTVMNLMNHLMFLTPLNYRKLTVLPVQN
ncbi:DUF1643 domain-containing protein [Alkalihalobacillus oceani]|uniref:DUF1643 domain-containing protein n=1 Tax=Halalkalibacter oceani TaxID=1653776 RepID=A0A9X2IQN4_9BACI|nr:DUF1643 domain-containing protein [Halalkalibacter oceani]MCM3716525.1 DUF1643 domain-containing protein [Halalkalibacter oceani]